MHLGPDALGEVFPNGLLHHDVEPVVGAVRLAVDGVAKLAATGIIAGARGDHYWAHPETRDDPKHKDFVAKFRAKTGAYPIYPTYHMAQALIGLKAGYEAAIKANGGKWPSPEQVADAMRKLKFKAFGREVTMREDGQGLEAQLLGVTKRDPKYPFAVIDKMVVIPAELVTAPVGQQSPTWIKSIDPALTKVLATDEFKPRDFK